MDGPENAIRGYDCVGLAGPDGLLCRRNLTKFDNNFVVPVCDLLL
jgi:hypothetical protein